jgi:GT2 family glycosyltransferase
VSSCVEMGSLAVSVIVLVLDRVEPLQECLESLFGQSPDDVAFEVIVVANGTRAELVDQVASRRGLRVVRVPANLGFAGGCNLGARFAQGNNLVFLNDDTAVTAGWLKALVERAGSEPDIGAVCAKLVGFEEKLQEAGSVVWRDARTDRVGLGADAGDPRYIVARDVDSASACGLLVRRDAWNAVGGFDEDFFPAYYEDVDLCFRLRQAGYRVVYEPNSVIRHRGSVSTAPELRLFAAEQNAKRFVEKWQNELAKRRSFPGDPGLAEYIIDVIAMPPKPSTSPKLDPAFRPSTEPSDEDIRELAMTALTKDLAFKDAFIASELRRLQTQLAKVKRMQRMIRRIPIVRSVWRRTTARF